MIYSKIHPQTKDEIDLLHDCDLPFAKTKYTAIVLDPSIIDIAESAFIQADPKQCNLKPKKY